jgi:hypothetical protein
VAPLLGGQPAPPTATIGRSQLGAPTATGRFVPGGAASDLRGERHQRHSACLSGAVDGVGRPHGTLLAEGKQSEATPISVDSRLGAWAWSPLPRSTSYLSIGIFSVHGAFRRQAPQVFLVRLGRPLQRADWADPSRSTQYRRRSARLPGVRSGRPTRHASPHR